MRVNSYVVLEVVLLRLSPLFRFTPQFQGTLFHFDFICGLVEVQISEREGKTHEI